VDYLSEDPPGEPQTRWPEAIAFYNEEIEPLLETNYYRGLGEDGNPLDRFWLIDRWFIGILALEFAMRTVYLSRRYKGVNWIDAIVWRWYDLMFFLPFWRWLRVIPVTIRLGQAKLVNLAIVGNRIRRAIVTHFAIELTEIVVIRVIDQVQNLVIRGEVRQFLLSSSSSRRYIDINGVDEIEVITKRVTDIIVGQVLPKIKPDIDAFLSHNVNMVLQGSPMYRGLGNLPNFEQGSNQLVNGMVGQLSQSIYDAIQSALEDEKGAELTRKIIASFVQVSRKEALSQRQTVEEIESLMNDLLEEVKINYVKRLSEEDVEELQQEAQEQVYELVEN
jgi:siroheme synthase (precorrin-2 oxidase/ferrochelatase)